jgi:predicted RecA/RadA family phage recombinase
LKNYRAPGEVMEFTAPSGGVVSGTGVKIGALLVIPTTTALVGEKFNGLVDGVIEHAKLSTEVWTEGLQVNWDNTNKRFTVVTTGNFKAGNAAAPTVNPSATGLVRLNGIDMGAALA